MNEPRATQKFFGDPKRAWLSLLAALLAVRWVAAWFSDGYNVPDELFQVIEPAFWKISGYGYRTWEWQRGIRSWFVPDIYSALMRVGYAFGLSRSQDLMIFLRIITGTASLIVPWWGYRLGERLYGARAAWWAALILGLWWTSIYFGVRTMGETATAFFALPAVWWFFEGSERKKSGLLFWSGAFIGLAFAARFQSLLFGVGIGAVLLRRREIRLLSYFCLGFLLILFLQGLLDLFTWGQFLHSPIEYFRFNLFEGGAAKEFGVAPWHRYLTALNRFFSLPVAAMVVAFSLYHLSRSWRRTGALWAPFAVFALAHNLTGHKEDRFILPLLPFLMIFAFFGALDFFRARPRPRWLAALLIAVLVGGGLNRMSKVAWRFNTDLTELFISLGQRADLRGFGTFHDVIPSLFYIHRDVVAYRHPDHDIPSFVRAVKGKKLNYIHVSFEEPELIAALKAAGVSCERQPDLSLVYRCREELSPQ